MTQNGVKKCTIFPRMALKQTFSLFAVKEHLHKKPIKAK
jgi:hypothetical protein